MREEIRKSWRMQVETVSLCATEMDALFGCLLFFLGENKVVQVRGLAFCMLKVRADISNII